jgi:hypothetical protein
MLGNTRCFATSVLRTHIHLARMRVQQCGVLRPSQDHSIGLSLPLRTVSSLLSCTIPYFRRISRTLRYSLSPFVLQLLSSQLRTYHVCVFS